jgi:hypothetical protein
MPVQFPDGTSVPTVAEFEGSDAYKALDDSGRMQARNKYLNLVNQLGSKNIPDWTPEKVQAVGQKFSQATQASDVLGGAYKEFGKGVFQRTPLGLLGDVAGGVRSGMVRTDEGVASSDLLQSSRGLPEAREKLIASGMSDKQADEVMIGYLADSVAGKFAETAQQRQEFEKGFDRAPVTDPLRFAAQSVPESLVPMFQPSKIGTPVVNPIGTVAGGGLQEVLGTLREELGKVIDITNPEEVAQVIGTRQGREYLADAEMKGIIRGGTIGILEGIAQKFGAKGILKADKAAGKAAQAVKGKVLGKAATGADLPVRNLEEAAREQLFRRGVAEVGADLGGAGFAEYGAQKAAGQETNVEEIVGEMLGSGGSQIGASLYQVMVEDWQRKADAAEQAPAEPAVEPQTVPPEPEVEKPQSIDPEVVPQAMKPARDRVAESPALQERIRRESDLLRAQLEDDGIDPNSQQAQEITLWYADLLERRINDPSDPINQGLESELIETPTIDVDAEVSDQAEIEGPPQRAITEEATDRPTSDYARGIKGQQEPLQDASREGMASPGRARERFSAEQEATAPQRRQESLEGLQEAVLPNEEQIQQEQQAYVASLEAERKKRQAMATRKRERAAKKAAEKDLKNRLVQEDWWKAVPEADREMVMQQITGNLPLVRQTDPLAEPKARVEAEQGQREYDRQRGEEAPVDYGPREAKEGERPPPDPRRERQRIEQRAAKSRVRTVANSGGVRVALTDDTGNRTVGRIELPLGFSVPKSAAVSEAIRAVSKATEKFTRRSNRGNKDLRIGKDALVVLRKDGTVDIIPMEEFPKANKRPDFSEMIPIYSTEPTHVPRSVSPEVARQLGYPEAPHELLEANRAEIEKMLGSNLSAMQEARFDAERKTQDQPTAKPEQKPVPKPEAPKPAKQIDRKVKLPDGRVAEIGKISDEFGETYYLANSEDLGANVGGVTEDVTLGQTFTEAKETLRIMLENNELGGKPAPPSLTRAASSLVKKAKALDERYRKASDALEEYGLSTPRQRQLEDRIALAEKQKQELYDGTPLEVIEEAYNALADDFMFTDEFDDIKAGRVGKQEAQPDLFAEPVTPPAQEQPSAPRKPKRRKKKDWSTSKGEDFDMDGNWMVQLPNGKTVGIYKNQASLFGTGEWYVDSMFVRSPEYDDDPTLGHLGSTKKEAIEVLKKWYEDGTLESISKPKVRKPKRRKNFPDGPPKRKGERGGVRPGKKAPKKAPSTRPDIDEGGAYSGAKAVAAKSPTFAQKAVRTVSDFGEASRATRQWIAERYLPIKNRLRMINSKIFTRVARSNFDAQSITQKELREIKDYLEGVSSIQGEDHVLQFKTSRLSGDSAKIREIAKKYGFMDGYRTMRKVLDRKFENTDEAGLPVQDVTEITVNQKFLDLVDEVQSKYDKSGGTEGFVVSDTPLRIGQVLDGQWLEDHSTHRAHIKDLAVEAEATTREYWPRSLYNYSEMRKALGLKEDTPIEKAIREEELRLAQEALQKVNREAAEAASKALRDGKQGEAKRILDEALGEVPKMSDTQKDRFVGRWLSGMTEEVDLSTASNNFFKQRVFKNVTLDEAMFYEDPDVAAINLIRRVNEVSAKRKVLGLNRDPLTTVEDAIGGLVNQMIKDGDFDSNAQEQVKAILTAYFNNKSINNVGRTYKNVENMLNIANVISSLVQLADTFGALLRYGTYDAAMAKAVWDALWGKGDVSLEDIGADTNSLQDILNTSPPSVGNQTARVAADASEWAAKQAFKVSLFRYLDTTGKQALLNLAYQKMRKRAKANRKWSNEMESLAKDAFPDEPERVDAIREVLKKDEMGADPETRTTDIKADDDLRYLLFLELSEMQPISPLNMPQKYLEGGTFGKLKYQFMSFTLNRWGLYHQQVRDKNLTGAERTIAGLQLLVISLLAEGSAMAIQDLALRREEELDEKALSYFLRAIGFNRYFTGQLAQGNTAQALGAIFPLMPKTRAFETVIKIPKGGDAGAIPIFGRVLDRYNGEGKEYNEKRMRDIMYRPDYNWLGESIDYSGGAKAVGQRAAYAFAEVLGGKSASAKIMRGSFGAKSKPRWKITRNGVDVEMTPEQYQEFLRRSGELTGMKLRSKGMPLEYNDKAHEVYLEALAEVRNSMFPPSRGRTRSRRPRRRRTR